MTILGKEEWSMVIPVRDTDEEYNFLNKAMPAAMKLAPSEIIIGVDAPASQRIIDRVNKIATKTRYKGQVRFLAIEKTNDWNFQLAKIHWHCFKSASYDKIYLIDIDSIPVANILEGLSKIGQDGIAVYNFTRRLRLKNLSDLIRYAFYRYRLTKNNNAFMGNYWIYKPYFFEVIKQEEYSLIYNGVDTFLGDKILADTRFKMETSKKIGVKSMRPENEDYPWRQFQLGVWIGADDERWLHLEVRRRQRKGNKLFRKHPVKLARNIINAIIHFRIWDIDRYPLLHVIWFAFCHQHPYVVKGYKWAKVNADHEIVKVARTMELNTWSYQGGKLLSKIEGLKIKGTGAAK